MRSPSLGSALLALLALSGASCGGEEPAPGSSGRGFAVLEEHLEPFRSEFNARTDHVRAVLLVGPT